MVTRARGGEKSLMRLSAVREDRLLPGSYNGYGCEVAEGYCGGCELFLGHRFLFLSQALPGSKVSGRKPGVHVWPNRNEFGKPTSIVDAEEIARWEARGWVNRYLV